MVNLISSLLQAQGPPSHVWDPAGPGIGGRLFGGILGMAGFLGKRDNGLRGRRQPGSCNWRILAPTNSSPPIPAPLDSDQNRQILEVYRRVSQLKQTGKCKDGR